MLIWGPCPDSENRKWSGVWEVGLTGNSYIRLMKTVDYLTPPHGFWFHKSGFKPRNIGSSPQDEDVMAAEHSKTQDHPPGNLSSYL